ncbi:hypothetical protein HLI_16665 [Halobacillus litoralis]|uniref:Uncharacterized protein n=1 Tax=Halobacillus litoralis TaxID=45668 RepID=A0A410MGA2_9BACI|nr:hypothetical protein HLI_16665 [Halobacillus litoralis]
MRQPMCLSTRKNVQTHGFRMLPVLFLFFSLIIS